MRKSLVAIGASLVVALGAVIVVFAWGVRRVPSFPSLERSPDPSVTGVIAYFRWSTDRREGCVYARPAGGGAEKQLACGPSLGSDARFTPEGKVQIATYLRTPSTPTYEVSTFDPGSGELLSKSTSTGSGPIGYYPYSDTNREGATARVVERRLELRAADGTTRVLLDAKGAPEDYYLNGATWSPDGRWIVVFDNEQRALVLAAEGEPRPRILVRNATGPIAWWQPGVPTPTQPFVPVPTTTPPSIPVPTTTQPVVPLPTQPAATAVPCGATTVARTGASGGNTVVFDFAGLAGVCEVSTYSQDGVVLRAEGADWVANPNFGNPAPFISFRSAATGTGSVTVTANGARFRFRSVDLYSSVTPIPFVVIGSLDGKVVFESTGTIPNTFGAFRTVTAPPDSALLDTLSIRLTNDTTQGRNPMGLDTLVLEREP